MRVQDQGKSYLGQPSWTHGENPRGGSYSRLSSLLRGWGQMKANNSRWPTFNGIFVNYPRFMREWVALHADLSHCGKQRLDSQDLKGKVY
jgi:hypothetical protein